MRYKWARKNVSDRCAPKKKFLTVLEHENGKQIVDLLIYPLLFKNVVYKLKNM